MEFKCQFFQLNTIFCCPRIYHFNINFRNYHFCCIETLYLKYLNTLILKSKISYIEIVWVHIQIYVCCLPFCNSVVIFLLQSNLTTARPPFSRLWTTSQSTVSFSIRSLTSCLKNMYLYILLQMSQHDICVISLRSLICD